MNFLYRNGHMMTHRNKKPYECKAEGCGKSYCDARSLRRHTENHHAGILTLQNPNLVTALGSTLVTTGSPAATNSNKNHNNSSFSSNTMSPGTPNGKYN